ncbi:MAG: SsrA-binding protein SmpB [Holosporaceae bacterium]|jgi:SsrA-binding protein|nr:SsrA-binding protein SmpB [Rhodospirillaceae bacterium]
MTKQVAQNRRARFDYEMVEKLTAGLVLVGTEVKSLRLGRCSLNESYAVEQNGELFLVGANIAVYPQASRFNHDPTRPRKLLLKGKQLAAWLGAIRQKGLTIVPLSIFFADNGRAKCELALARGRKTHDKREAIKQRDWQREKAQLLRR